MTKQVAMYWLWGTATLNVVLGALVWVFNWFVQLTLSPRDRSYNFDLAEALLWQEIGSSLFGFGVLVFVITFATAAIVDAIESSKRTDKAAEK